MAQDGKTLQARVDKQTADKFAAVARARRMSESELLRVTINAMLRDAESNVDMLKDALRREFEANMNAIDSIPDPQKVAAHDSTTPGWPSGLSR